MTVSELIKRIKKDGCQLKRNGSEHDIWINTKTGQEAQVPRHKSKELKTGTANRILKDLGLK
jgi:Predicted periplasmic or secreted lipoprotein